jgi:hypothetical protein
MSVDNPRSPTGFAQLYFQAAKVRHAELSSFFASFDELPEKDLAAEKWSSAIYAASEILDYLERAAGQARSAPRSRSLERRFRVNPPE